MSRFWALLLAVPLFAATVPNRYIVELTLDPVAGRAVANGATGNSRARLHTAAAERQRTAIRAQQATARAAIEKSGGRIAGTLENLSNALLVEIPGAEVAALAAAPA